MKYLLIVALVLLGGCADGEVQMVQRDGEGVERNIPSVGPLPERVQVADATRDDATLGGGAADSAVVVYPGYPLPGWPQPTATTSPTPMSTVPGDAGSDTQEEGRVDGGGDTHIWDGSNSTPAEPGSEPIPAAGTLVSGVELTVYTCLGDSTGAYCPGGAEMACGGDVHRGAAACGWQWECGQRFRIIGDPQGMVYTCLDRGGAVTGIDVWFYDYYAEGRPWRIRLPQPVTVELLN